MLNGTTTRSPTARWCTSAPTSSTMPIGSWPTTSPGVMNGVRGSYRWRSEPHSPVEVIRTMASVGCSIRGSGTSSTRMSRRPCQVTAFTMSSFPSCRRGRATPVPGARDPTLPRMGGKAPGYQIDVRIRLEEVVDMPSKSANVKNEKQYEALKDKGMSKERAAKIANSPDASKKGGKSVRQGRQQQAGRHHRAEEGSRPQGRQGRCQEELTGDRLLRVLSRARGSITGHCLSDRGGPALPHAVRGVLRAARRDGGAARLISPAAAPRSRAATSTPTRSTRSRRPKLGRLPGARRPTTSKLPSNATKTVDCAEPHTAETFAVGELPESLEDAGYDDREVGAFAYETCSKKFMAFLGADESLVMRTVVSWAWFRPSEKAWDDGARWYRCDVVGGGDDSTSYVDLPDDRQGPAAQARRPVDGVRQRRRRSTGRRRSRAPRSTPGGRSRRSSSGSPRRSTRATGWSRSRRATSAPSRSAPG